MTKIKHHITQSSTLHHLVFWLLVLITFVFFDRSSLPIPLVIKREAINVFLLAFLVSFNFLYLIPRYLSQRNLFIYFIALILSCLAVTPIKTTILHLLFSEYPSEQSYILNSQRLFFVSNIIIVTASTFFKIITDWITLNREKKELHTRTIQSELKFLKAQINPHFLFNTLNNLYALTLKKSDDAPQTVLKLSEMMRYMLYECNERWVSLEKELNYVENYISLEKIRQHSNFDIQLDIDGDPKNLKVAPMIFIPFIENSFKHGINHLLKDGIVHINIFIKDQELDFHITNTTPQEKPIQDGKSGGIGLTNVKKRLQLLYPNAYKLKIKELNELYKVHLHLLLNKNKQI